MWRVGILDITASRSSALRRMRRCEGRLWSWDGRASIAITGRRRYYTCFGEGSRGMRCLAVGDI